MRTRWQVRRPPPIRGGQRCHVQVKHGERTTAENNRASVLPPCGWLQGGGRGSRRREQQRNSLPPPPLHTPMMWRVCLCAFPSYHPHPAWQGDISMRTVSSGSSAPPPNSVRGRKPSSLPYTFQRRNTSGGDRVRCLRRGEGQSDVSLLMSAVRPWMARLQGDLQQWTHSYHPHDVQGLSARLDRVSDGPLCQLLRYVQVTPASAPGGDGHHRSGCVETCEVSGE